MPASILPFSKVEYERRLTKVRSAMEAKGLDLLFIEDPVQHGLAYRLRRLVVLRSPGSAGLPDEDPIWWGREQDAERRDPHLLDGRDRARRYPDHFVQSTTVTRCRLAA